MHAYRDDRAVLRHRIRELEEELHATREALSKREAELVTARTLRRAQRAAERMRARTRGAVALPASIVIGLVAVAAILGAGVAASASPHPIAFPDGSPRSALPWSP